MSLILKGIDMPKENDYINISIYKDGSIYEQDENGGSYFKTGHKAIQIPKGARLIDANELSKEVEIEIEEFLTESGIRSAIRNAPTILEEEQPEVPIKEVVKDYITATYGDINNL